jgi:hypothetical protein
MTANSDNKNISNDEIDLLELFRKMGRGINRIFKKTGKGIIISIVFMLRKWVYLALSIILAIGLSYFFKYTAERFYTSEMIVSCNAAGTSEVMAYINKLHQFTHENNVSAITEALGLENSKSRLIKDIEAFWIIDRNKDGTPDFIDYNNSHNVYDTTNIRMPDRLAIRIKITAPGELTLIRDGVFRYVASNRLFEEQNNIRLSQIDETLTRLNYDISQLDSLQKVKYFEETRNRTPEKGGQMIFLQEQKTQLIYDDIYLLYTRKQSLERQKTIFPGIITLLSDFTVPSKPNNSGMYYGRILIPLFFGICLIILIMVHNRKKLLEVYNKY